MQCFPMNQIFLKKHGLIVDNNADLWALIGEKCGKLLFIQKCPQFSQKLSASNACMLATFSCLGMELVTYFIPDIASLKSRVYIIAWFILCSKVTLERANRKEAISSKIISF